MAERTRLSSKETEVLLAQYPELPDSYLTYLRDVGWGTSPRGHMIYSGPISVDEVYSEIVDGHRVLIGDDMQGYCLGYDFDSQQFGEYSASGDWSNFDDAFDLAKHLRTEEM